MRNVLLTIMVIGCTLTTAPAADSPYIYGIHWWGYNPSQPIDDGPCQLLDCETHGGWTVETVLTHSASWWSASYYSPLINALAANKNMSVITRIDYDWGQTVPYNVPSWPNDVVSSVNTLKNGSHIWIIGNEPNIVGEGNNWPDSQVTPAGYAQIYRDVRNAIHANAQASPLGEHVVLIAAPSPGGVIGGIRWMDGNAWLGQVLDSIPNEEIDGIAIHAYGPLSAYHSSYVSQLNLIDSKGLQDRPVYITESNVGGGEATKAQFARDMFTDLHAWNTTPGNHNIVCACWFVYDGDSGWDSLAIESYRYGGEYAYPSPFDLYRAYEETVDLRLPAGAIGTPQVGELGVTPTAFSQTIYEEETPDPDTFEVRNLDTTTLNYSISDDAEWLTVSPTYGSSSGEPDTITVTYDTDTLPPDDYTGTIRVTANGAPNSPVDITVHLTVLASPYADADFDRDFDVDQEDFGHLQACFTGAGVAQTDPACEDAMLDNDGDVDSDDYSIFEGCMTGADIMADPQCTP